MILILGDLISTEPICHILHYYHHHHPHHPHLISCMYVNTEVTTHANNTRSVHVTVWTGSESHPVGVRQRPNLHNGQWVGVGLRGRERRCWLWTHLAVWSQASRPVAAASSIQQAVAPHLAAQQTQAAGPVSKFIRHLCRGLCSAWFAYLPKDAGGVVFTVNSLHTFARRVTRVGVLSRGHKTCECSLLQLRINPRPVEYKTCRLLSLPVKLIGGLGEMGILQAGCAINDHH